MCYQKTMSGFSLDLGPLKEPLGFIRVLEWVRIVRQGSTCVGKGPPTAGNTSFFRHVNMSRLVTSNWIELDKAQTEPFILNNNLKFYVLDAQALSQQVKR